MSTSPSTPLLRRLAAFSSDPAGGNPAGVWLGDALPAPMEMLRIAAEVGYSETAFVAAEGEGYVVRYYSPEAEVSFCGHATIATGVFLGELMGEGTYRLETAVGKVPVGVTRQDGALVAAFTSVAPEHRSADEPLLGEALSLLGWTHDELAATIPPALTYAGAWHLMLPAARPASLDRLEYDFDALKQRMIDAGLTTVQTVWRERERVFRARNAFPVGGVVEDPATGASAAALGGYLRDAGLVAAPFSFVIHQGDAMGRPSLISVDVPMEGGILVSGTAAPIAFEART